MTTCATLASALGPENYHPVWSPDGEILAWASIDDGIHGIYRPSPRTMRARPRYLGGGDWPVWSPDGKTSADGDPTPD